MNTKISIEHQDAFTRTYTFRAPRDWKKWLLVLIPLALYITILLGVFVAPGAIEFVTLVAHGLFEAGYSPLDISPISFGYNPTCCLPMLAPLMLGWQVYLFFAMTKSMRVRVTASALQLNDKRIPWGDIHIAIIHQDVLMITTERETIHLGMKGYDKADIGALRDDLMAHTKGHPWSIPDPQSQQAMGDLLKQASANQKQRQ